MAVTSSSKLRDGRLENASELRLVAREAGSTAEDVRFDGARPCDRHSIRGIRH